MKKRNAWAVPVIVVAGGVVAWVSFGTPTCGPAEEDTDGMGDTTAGGTSTGGTTGGTTGSLGPGCLSGGAYNGAMLPRVAAPYAPLPWPFDMFRLARDGVFDLAPPSISTFVYYLVGGAGESTRQTYRGKMLNGLDITTFRALTFAPGIAPVVAPSFPMTGGGADPAVIQQMIDKLDEPEQADCTIEDFLKDYERDSSAPKRVIDKVIKTRDKEVAHKFESPANYGLFIYNGSAEDSSSNARVRSLATDAETAWKSDSAKPLSGVPFVVKGQTDVATFPTMLGAGWGRIRPVPGADAAVVGALVGQGAIGFGNTNMHELGGGATGVNPIWGAARNAFNRLLVSGGSSSGVAAAVALKLTPFGVGSDAGGSIRLPAAWNGLYGLKPTYGSMSNAGNYPLATTLTMPGPMARTLRDLWIAAVVMSGHRHYYDGFFMGGPGPDGNLANFHGPGRPLTVGVHRDWVAQADPAVQAAFNGAIAQLQAAGADVIRFDGFGLGIPKLPWVLRTQIVLFIYELAQQMTLEPAYTSTMTSAEQRIALTMGTLSGVFSTWDLNSLDIVQARKIRAELIQSINQVFCAGVDVIATPTSGIVPFPIAEDAFPDGESDIVKLDKINRYTALANLTGHPALTVPIGKWMGLQLIGAPHRERDLFVTAYAYEKKAAYGGNTLKPEKDLCPRSPPKPVIAMSTVDSSVEYAQLCVYETTTGAVPTFSTPAECTPITNFQNNAAGSCVKPPLQADRDRYNADALAFKNGLQERFKVASGILGGTGFCWAGVKGAVITEGEDDPEDSFGPQEYETSGTSATARVGLQDLKDMFENLYAKHEFKDKDGNPDKKAEAVLLLDVDNSGSITLSQWPAANKASFLSWLATEYPKVTVRESTISNYQIDGENWLGRQLKNYNAYIKSVEDAEKDAP